MSAPAGDRRVDLLGVPVDAVSQAEVLGLVAEAIRSRGQLHIGVVNAAKVVNMRRDAALRGAVLSSDMILADGMAVVWGLRILGRPIPERVPGIDLMFGMLRRGQELGWRVYCLGATEEVSRSVADSIASDYPGLVLAGRHHGYFDRAGEAEVVSDIKRASPDILLVAMTSPKKEQFLERWSRELRVPVCHGVGGSFDVMAGKVRRAPRIWQRLGLEWLYRVVQEPRRLWRRYLVTNTLFIWMLLCELLGRRFALRRR